MQVPCLSFVHLTQMSFVATAVDNLEQGSETHSEHPSILRHLSCVGSKSKENNCSVSIDNKSITIYIHVYLRRGSGDKAGL